MKPRNSMLNDFKKDNTEKLFQKFSNLINKQLPATGLSYEKDNLDDLKHLITNMSLVDLSPNNPTNELRLKSMKENISKVQESIGEWPKAK
ncbi:MAG: hypothetical protein JWM09_694, partial [Francisellaceae bacterium]|nr:hypothetical protein [Francisellaceae bacterium]